MSSLHRALHFGHLAVASILIQSGASTTLEDSKYRTPIDLLSGSVSQAVGNGDMSEGQLGYTFVDTQPTPPRVSLLRSKIVVAVAAANKHTAVVSDSGEVLTWGCNKEGQLGYGTSNSASN